VKKGGSVKKRESVIRAVSEEKVGGGGDREGGLRGEGGLHISSSVINLMQFLHTIILYSSYTQHLNIHVWHCIDKLYIKLHGRLYDRELGV
jgi:hypothetical protein